MLFAVYVEPERTLMCRKDGAATRLLSTSFPGMLAAEFWSTIQLPAITIEDQPLAKMTDHGSGASTAQLVLTLSPLQPSPHPLKDLPLYHNETLLIGRATGTSNTIPSAKNGYYESMSMSRRHCIFFVSFARGEREIKQVYVQDLGAANGTYVNGARLGSDEHASVPMPVQIGDRIGFAEKVVQDGVVYEGVDVVVDIKFRAAVV